MENKILIVSDSMLINSRTYIPLEEKMQYAKQIAEACVEDADVAEQNKIGEKLLPLPNLKVENMAMKKMLMLQVLLGAYLHIEIKEMTIKKYDEYAGCHILNQIERYRSNNTFRDIAYDLISDYREFEKIVATEIYNIKATANDPMARAIAIMQVYSTPENVQKAIEELKKMNLPGMDAVTAEEDMLTEAEK